MSLKFPSGNYPSSIGSGGGDKLVHWCHGAPGWVYMFIAAYKVSTMYACCLYLCLVCAVLDNLHGSNCWME